jgi:hypothetical protein
MRFKLQAFLGVMVALDALAAPGVAIVCGQTAPMRNLAVKEIVDARNGDRWLLVRDGDHPGGPGRWILVAGAQKAGADTPAAQPSFAVPPLPVIHFGQPLIVEEHTAVADVRMEAMALEPAATGTIFKARLKIGGKVVRVVAQGPGQAIFAPESEVQP